MRSSKQKPLESIEAVDVDKLASCLPSWGCPADEWQPLLDALGRRHDSVLRLRRGGSSPELLPPQWLGDPIEWYPLARRPAPRPAAVGDGSDRISRVADTRSIPDRPSRWLAYAAGEFYLQDAGSLLALAACQADTDALTGQTVCDLCAAPGGKATGLLEAIGERGFLLAAEPIRSRQAALTYNLARTGADRYAVTGLDPEQLARRIGGVFDLVLVDAPCSGQALLGRQKQSVGALDAANIELNSKRQQRILRAAVDLVRPGGRLVYSTCTFAELENESQVRWLIETCGMVPDTVDRLQHLASPAAPASYRLWPQHHGCAGAFAARLVRPQHAVALDGTDETDEGGSSKQHRRRRDAAAGQEVSPEAGALLSDVTGGTARDLSLRQRDWIVDGFAGPVPDWLQRIDYAGPEWAHRAGKTWKPAHGLALRRSPHDPLPPGWELTPEEARAYWRGLTVDCPRRGWQVARLEGRPLGWVKSSGRVGKNHLPAFARLTGG